MLTRQAKILTERQQAALLRFVEAETRYPARNRVITLLSFKAGLRAKEIALLQWEMLTDVEGTMTGELRLPNRASKGRSSGRVIPIHPALKTALSALYQQRWSALGRPPRGSEYVLLFQRETATAVGRIGNVHWLFYHWFKALGFNGASSHSGRRTFITTAAKKIGAVGGTLRDVQRLAGHSSLQTTARYIEHDSEAVDQLMRIM